MTGQSKRIIIIVCLLAMGIAFLLVIKRELNGKSGAYDSATYTQEQQSMGEEFVARLLRPDFLSRGKHGPFFYTIYQGRGAHAQKMHALICEKMTARIGQPYSTIPGNSPFNQGALYTYWRYQSYRISLSLRFMSSHAQRQGAKPTVEFEVRPISY